MLDGAAFEREELLRLLKASRLPEAAIDDFERCNIGTIMQFASYSVGKLTTEPPDGPVLTALLTALRTGSALVGADKWPDPGVGAEVAAYTDTVTKMTMLCRFVTLQKDKAAQREMAYVGMAGSDASTQRAREEEEKKNHKAKALELSAAASAMYNTDFNELCDSSTLVATHHSFQRNRLTVARLRSGKYGHTSVHLAEKAHWVAADDHTIKEESSEVGSTSLTRNGHVLIQIFNVTESLVIAGASEINKTMAHSAGAHGTVNRGTKNAKQVNFDLTTKLQVDKAFTMLSGHLSPKALEALFDDQFIPTLGSMMVSGHSCASATMSIIANAAWMRATGEKLAPAAGAGSSTEASASAAKSKMTPEKGGTIKNEAGEVVGLTMTKVTQMRSAHEKQVAEMSAARKKDKERHATWQGLPRPPTSYRGYYEQPRYDSRHDEAQYEPRRDRK